MRGDVTILDSVLEDLRGIEDSMVMLEILDLAGTELEIPRSLSSIQGRLEKQPQMMWRRAVRFADQAEHESLNDLGAEDDDRTRPHAYDYVLIYRLLTSDDKIVRRRSKDGLVIVALTDNDIFSPEVFRLPPA